MSMQLLPSKDPGEVVDILFDFTSATAAPVEISTASADCFVASGTDPDAEGMIEGTVITGSPVPQIVAVRVRFGVPGTTYRIRCQATFVNDVVSIITGYLPVVAQPI